MLFVGDADGWLNAFDLQSEALVFRERFGEENAIKCVQVINGGSLLCSLEDGFVIATKLENFL